MQKENACLCKEHPVPAGARGAIAELAMSLKLSHGGSLYTCFLLSLRVFSVFLAAFVCSYMGWGWEEFGREAYGISGLGLGTAILFHGIMSLDLSGCWRLLA